MSDKSETDARWEQAREILREREQEVRFGLRDKAFDDDPYYLSEDEEPDINAYIEAMHRPSGRRQDSFDTANRLSISGLKGLTRLASVVVAAIWPKRR